MTSRLEIEKLNGVLDKVQTDKKMLAEKVKAVTARGESNIHRFASQR